MGTEGADRITGLKGNDVLMGKGGADTFVFAAGDGYDQVTDFTPGVDHLEFRGLTAAQVRVTAGVFNGIAGVDVAYGSDGAHVLLQGVSALKAGDILFA
ncbi:MAG: hypothetical protein K2X11_15150 [Acetobacteraceae bacterium]|nr:hypothetical protein [Acetobacteraceae bacterium]